MSRTIFYIGDFKSTIMDAQCQLVLGNCMILRDLGYNVVLIGNDPNAATEDPILSKQYIDGFEFYNIAFDRSVKGIFKIRKNTKKVVSILAQYDTPQFIFFYGTPGFAEQLNQLYLWCKRRNVKMVYNCVDISSLAHGSKFERFAKNVDKKVKENFIVHKADAVLAVSSYIKQYYYEKKPKPISIIPPLKDINTNALQENSNSIIDIVYVGVPFPTDGRIVDEAAYKDRIDLFIDLLLSVKGKTRPFCLNIYGLTEEQYVRTVQRQKEKLEHNSEIIQFHGRIPHQESIERLMKADYSVVYRSVNEMTMAGFSSKLVESIWSGTPVIMTDTSDYKQYLSTGDMCQVIDYQDPITAQEQIIAALNKDINQINSMKKRCYESNIFFYKNYIEEMRKLLMQLS